MKNKHCDFEVCIFSRVSMSRMEEIESLRETIDIIEQSNDVLNKHNDELLYKYNDLVAKYNKDVYEVQESAKLKVAQMEDKIKKLDEYILELEEANISYSYDLDKQPFVKANSPYAALMERYESMKTCFNCERFRNDEKIDTCEENMHDYPQFCTCEHWI